MKRKVLFLLVLVTSLFLLGSCSFFEEDPEGVKDISFTESENGDVVVTVTYYDEFESTKEQIIPSGLDGKDGVSVSIEVVREKDLYRNKVILNLSDGTQQVMYVPDGVRIVDVTTTDFEGANGMILHYSDGTQSDAIRLPKGDKGNGIDMDKSSWVVNDDGSVDVEIYYTDADDPIAFTIPTGKTGNGIESITPKEEGGKFILTVLYTSGQSKDVSFTRPVYWFQGYGAPTSAANIATVANAKVGDYYFDYYGRKIYNLSKKAENESSSDLWDLVVDFSQATDLYRIDFLANDDDEPELPEEEKHRVEEYKNFLTGIQNGTYLIGQIPIPTRIGYEFVGWATTQTVTPITGYLTELTPITSDLTLYAIWKKIE